MPMFTVRKTVEEVKTITVTKTYEAQIRARDEDAAYEKASAKEDDVKFWGEVTDEDQDEDVDTSVEFEAEESDDE